MKKIILILFLFFLFYSCYYIYNITEDNKLYLLSIGDNLSSLPSCEEEKKISINRDFINNDYHTTDLLNIIKYNQEKEIADDTISIHRLLKKSDIVILSIGMNDIYYKLNDNTKEIYTYLNGIIGNYEEILFEISKYEYRKVYILGYYNVTNNYQDIFTYINYKLQKLTDKYHYTYIDLNNVFYNHPEYVAKNNNFYPNKEGFDEITKLIVENLKKT